MRDHRIYAGLVNDVLDVLDRHGFAVGDDEHARRAVFLAGDLARIYEGTQDHPFGPSQNPAPVPHAAPGPDIVAVTASDLDGVLLVLDATADNLRDEAETCTHCQDQSCPACQLRFHDADVIGELAGRLLYTARNTPVVRRGQAEPPGPARQPGPAADKEAGQ